MVRAMAWSPDSRHIATGSNDRTARIWDPGRGTQLAILHGHTRAIWGLIRDAGSGRQHIVAGVLADRAEAIAWFPDSTWLAAASRDGTAHVWDATASPVPR